MVRSAAHAGNALDGLVQEAGVLGLEIELLVQAALLQLMFDAGQVPQLAQEPLVDLGGGIDGIKVNAAVECLKYGEDTLIVLYMQQFPDLIVGLVGILGQTQGVETQLDGADRLHNGLLEAGTDGHYLTSGLHLGAQGTLAVYKLIKGPLGELADDVVHSGLVAGPGGTGYGVADLVQTVADGDLGGNLGDGITGGLGSQCRRTGYTGVYLDDGVFLGARLQSELTVAAALNAQLVYNVNGSFPQHAELLGGEAHCRSDYDGVTGVDAHRVHVLHGADGDGVAHAVPDDLELDLLPAGDALFNQDLGNGRQTQTILSDLMEFFHGGGNTAAGTAHGEGRTDDDRQADLLGEGDGVGQIFHNLGGDTGLTDLLHGVLEHLAVLSLVDGGALGAQQTHIVFRQESRPYPAASTGSGRSVHPGWRAGHRAFQFQ